jgi:hypothetical protein
MLSLSLVEHGWANSDNHVISTEVVDTSKWSYHPYLGMTRRNHRIKMIGPDLHWVRGVAVSASFFFFFFFFFVEESRFPGRSVGPTKGLWGQKSGEIARKWALKWDSGLCTLLLYQGHHEANQSIGITREDRGRWIIGFIGGPTADPI